MAKKLVEVPAYQMPAVELGKIVLWHDALDAPPTAMALVTAVGNETVSLLVIGPGMHNGLVREGVRHLDHPNKELIRAAEVGVWDYRQEDKELSERLSLLEQAVEDLGVRQTDDHK